MGALLEGDGLAPLVSVDGGRGSAILLRLHHGVLPGGGGCDHWDAVRREEGRQGRETKEARGLVKGFKTTGSIACPDERSDAAGCRRPCISVFGLALLPRFPYYYWDCLHQ